MYSQGAIVNPIVSFWYSHNAPMMLPTKPKNPTKMPPLRKLKQKQKLSVERQPMMKCESERN